MNPPRIVRIPVLPFGLINAHMLVGEHGCVLVDTGLPGSHTKIERALKKQGRTFKDVKLIIVTHAHVDHAGTAAKLRELSGAPILAHAADLDYFEQRKKMTFCETGWFGRFFMRTGLILQPYVPFSPDILLQDDQCVDLQQYGIAGVARHTPGHTAGSVSVELVNGDAMVGDLVASGILLGGLVRTDHAIRPPFEDDPQTVSAELQRMVDAGTQRFFLGHGGPLLASEVQRHAILLRSLKPGRMYGMEAQCACPDRLDASV